MASDAKVLENVVLNKDSELKEKNDTIQRMVFIYFLDFLQFEYLSYFFDFRMKKSYKSNNNLRKQTNIIAGPNF
jgi:hypothetical protein